MGCWHDDDDDWQANSDGEMYLCSSMESNGVDEVMIFTGDLKRSRAMTDDGKEKFNDGIMSATDKICCMLYVQPNKCYYFFLQMHV